MGTGVEIELLAERSVLDETHRECEREGRVDSSDRAKGNVCVVQRRRRQKKKTKTRQKTALAYVSSTLVRDSHASLSLTTAIPSRNVNPKASSSTLSLGLSA